ncbi:WxL domain-containing protein [Enterococcus faecalis]|uniref:WxL domain-containing protein n=1 Tax=Enterococcus faecalis TaxID=1351 RepID=UPI001F593D31|nr:WxL domain-containing protein [Enterococcus faecalis]
MKKIFVSLLSTTILGGEIVFAADTNENMSADTPITAKLINNTGGTITPPTVTPDPDKPEVIPPVVNDPEKFGIAYYPGVVTIEAELNESGKQDILLQSEIHVGVKDRTREKNQWDLKASLEWTGANAKDLQSATIIGKNGQVQENDSGTLKPITNDTVTTTAGSLSISNVQSAIMSTDDTKIKNGIFDYSAEDFTLSIPEVSIVSAGEYQGNINWDLSTTP